MMARRFNRKHRIGNKIPAQAALARRCFHDSLRADMQISRQMAGADSIMADTEVMEVQKQAGGPESGPESGPVLRGLSVDGIGKKYDNRVVLRDVSLSVRRGEVVGLLGPNGAGKTTCFYSIMGLAMPDSGRILLDGHDITGLPMYRRAALGLGYLPQETSIFRGMTVEQNIMAVLEVAEPDAKARGARLEELLGEFNITRLRAAPAMALSGGERRRVEIARALAANPSIMLLDEPFAGIDPISIADIRALVVQLRARDIGVLITDHNVRETLEIVNRACIIYDGRVLFEGTPDALVADETVRRVYLGEDFSL
jgi:lipopolysaccharide export system ATP-binding protein